MQLGTPDNPATPENELFNYGVCFESDCTLFGDQCAEGETCQPISFSANFGQCRPVMSADSGKHAKMTTTVAPTPYAAMPATDPYVLPSATFGTRTALGVNHALQSEAGR